MLALRLTHAARPAVQLRRLLVAVASAGTGFLLLSSLGYAMGHPETPGAAALRLAWCLVPLAAAAHFALAVARTDPGTRPRPGLSAVGLGPARLMAISALTTALSCALGSLLALLLFLQLRGDLTGLPLDGAAAGFLVTDQPLPLPATLTLLALLPAVATATVVLALRPRNHRPPTGRHALALGRCGAQGRPQKRETFGAYGRFGARSGTRGSRTEGRGSDAASAQGDDGTRPAGDRAEDGPAGPDAVAEPPAPDSGWSDAVPGGRPSRAVTGLPWGVATLAAGMTVLAYASRSAPVRTFTDLPSDAAVLIGWIIIGAGLVLVSPGLTDLCGRLLQSGRPAALRLLAGRVLMAEATRIGRPLGVVCAVASAAYAMTVLYEGPAPDFGPLTTLGSLLVTGCTVATLLTAAVEARQSRADTTAALLRLGAPATMLRRAAALRAAALLALFGPFTLVVADLAALPRAR
ncbi:hypothetical protein J2Z21_004725 [Streptomyces griseochromogenes]|uniref:Uncharacterized protein n=1 Tax=Streptomyces griseochromogenes TaxID=68214 RepID=A0A1B1ATA6_9ACTN|nr:hypothetical protein [Streptomyces griseochromogenes]ANP49771.1 hypothetical protein AVL59_09250 [Streptomyces griseochromogenes]MBP2051748.1 hypothetical protein [Streptomyces griseochromogenes]